MCETLPKSERLNRKRIIDRLFSGAGKSMLAFPVRMVYMPVEEAEARVAMLVSVPKKRFKRAVRRNRVKRQVREAFRRHKQLLIPLLEADNLHMAMAFIWLDDKLWPSVQVDAKVRNLLTRVAERLQAQKEEA